MFDISMLKKMGDVIIKETYPNVPPSRMDEYLDYKIKISPYEYKSRAGCYNMYAKEIELSGITSSCRKDVVITYVHELSHHIETVNTGLSGHQASFYKIHTELLKTAINLKIITPEEIQQTETNKHVNRRKLAKMMDGYTRQGNKTLAMFMNTNFLKELPDEPPVNIIYKVKVPVEEKDIFKVNNFKWLNDSKVWCKEASNMAEKVSIDEFLSKNGYIALNIDNVSYYAKYISIVAFGDTYHIKEMLTEFGYKYNNNQWQKTINVKDLKKIKQEVSDLRISFGLKASSLTRSEVGGKPISSLKVGFKFSFNIYN